MKKISKVFGIGFHKTGTKSLGEALRLLGYRVCGPMWTREPDVAETVHERALEAARHYDAFQDNPWPMLYREMDRAFPGSRFILTECPTLEWIDRTERYFGSEETPMRRWIYGAGSPVGHRERYVQVYETHNRAVKRYFQSRPEDLLVFPLTTRPSWAQLCRFLGRSVPEQDFPHVNRST